MGGKAEYRRRHMSEKEKEKYLSELPGGGGNDDDGTGNSTTSGGAGSSGGAGGSGDTDELDTMPMIYYSSRRSYVLGESKFLAESDNELSVGGLFNMTCSLFDRAPLLKYRPGTVPGRKGIVGHDDNYINTTSNDSESEEEEKGEGEEEPASSLASGSISITTKKKRQMADLLTPVNTCPHPYVDVFEEDWDRPDLFDHEEEADGDLDWDADLDEDVRLLRDAKRLQRDRAKQGVQRLSCRNKKCQICYNEYGAHAPLYCLSALFLLP